MIQIEDLGSGRLYDCPVGSTLVVGRVAPGAQPDVPCDDPRVSRTHCHVRAEADGRVRIEDHSTYGTWINGERIDGVGHAAAGDRLRLGDDFQLAVRAREAAVCRALVFTDLVGSLDLKRRLGDEAAVALVDRHRGHVREALARAGGREVDNPGDGFFLVFDEAHAAVTFALALQAAHAGAPDLPAVRIGVHQGEVLERANPGAGKPLDVAGLAVDLAARIEGVAQPGQVLLSSSVFVAARGLEIGEPLVWRQHGPFLFDGFTDCALEIGEVALARLAGELPAPVGSAKARRCGPRAEAVLAQRYRIEEELGRGGAGVVYRAHDALLGRACAVKVLLAAGRAKPEELKRFEREALVGAKLGEHPGIAAVFDVGSWPETGELYLALELIEGASFDRVLAESDRRLRDGVAVVEQVARALAFAHEHDVVHRDVKPQNVIVRPSGEAVLTDFGLAKALGDAGTLTITGHYVGTIGYMAPEQLNDAKRTGPPADVYGLGALLYEVLVGRTPVAGKSWKSSIVAVLEGKIPAPEVEPTLDAVCLGALATEPAARPTAVALADALRAWLDTTP